MSDPAAVPPATLPADAQTAALAQQLAAALEQHAAADTTAGATAGASALQILNPGTASVLAFRAPQFCTHDPKMWFDLVECNFKANKITASLTKFSHASSLLPQDVLIKVSDVISKAILSLTPYEDLKAAVIKRLESSVSTRLHELLSKEELGNEKPSDLLRRMQRLLSDQYDKFDPALFRQLYYQRLPDDIQRNLFTVKDKLSLEDLAQLADDFMCTVRPGRVSVSQVTSPPPQAPSSETQALAQLIAQLTVQVNALANKVDERESRDRNYRPRQRSRSPSRNRKYEICWYHYKYGTKANKCIEPCDFKKPSGNSGDEH